MSNILEAIKLTQRIRRAEAAERRREVPEAVASSCRELLSEAHALGLELDDVIDAVRRLASHPTSSN